MIEVLNLRKWRQRRAIERQMGEFVEGARSLDHEENELSAPPQNEEIRLRAVWLAESYPLSHLEGLVGNLRRLTVGKGGLASSRDTVASVVARLESGAGGSSQLGPIVPPASNAFAYLDPIRLDLPEGVRYAFGAVHNLFPTYAALVIWFLLDDDASRRIERILRAEYRSYGVQHGSSISIMGPVSQKQRAVLEERRRLLGVLSHWFVREIPGLFAARAGARSFPSIELWTTKVAKPFEAPPSTYDELHSFVAALGWTRGFHNWRTRMGSLLRPQV